MNSTCEAAAAAARFVWKGHTEGRVVQTPFDVVYREAPFIPIENARHCPLRRVPQGRRNLQTAKRNMRPNPSECDLVGVAWNVAQS